MSSLHPIKSSNQYQREYYLKNRDRELSASNEYYAENKTAILEKAKTRWQRTMSNPVSHKLHLERQKRYKWRLKLEVLAHYGGKCACCGEAEPMFLTIHHLNGGGSAQRRRERINAGYVFYFWLKKNNYPEGYGVLCANCNSAKGYYGSCPHNDKLIKMNPKEREIE